MPRQDEDSTLRYYRDAVVANDYDVRRFGGAGGALLHELQVAAIAEALHAMPRAPRTIIDAGCGTGRLAPALSSIATVIGVDASTEMLSVARERGHRAEWVSADLRQLPFDDGSFDAAVSVWALNHVPAYLAVLQELARVSEHVVIAVPSGRSIYALTPILRRLGAGTILRRGTAAGRLPSGLRPCSFNFDERELCHALRAHGFNVWWQQKHLLLPIIPSMIASAYPAVERLAAPLTRSLGSFLVVGLTRGKDE